MELVFFSMQKIIYECIKFFNNLIFNVQKQNIVFYIFFLMRYLILIILITKNTHFKAAIKTRRKSISAMTA